MGLKIKNVQKNGNKLSIWIKIHRKGYMYTLSMINNLIDGVGVLNTGIDITGKYVIIVFLLSDVLLLGKKQDL